MKVLVMGGTQFNGRALVSELPLRLRQLHCHLRRFRCVQTDATRFDWSFEDALLQELR